MFLPDPMLRKDCYLCYGANYWFKFLHIRVIMPNAINQLVSKIKNSSFDSKFVVSYSVLINQDSTVNGNFLVGNSTIITPFLELRLWIFFGWYRLHYKRCSKADKTSSENTVRKTSPSIFAMWQMWHQEGDYLYLKKPSCHHTLIPQPARFFVFIFWF